MKKFDFDDLMDTAERFVAPVILVSALVGLITTTVVVYKIIENDAGVWSWTKIPFCVFMITICLVCLYAIIRYTAEAIEYVKWHYK